MRYCLDTSAVIEVFKDRGGMADLVRSIPKKDLFITVMTVGELEVGYAYDERVGGKQKRKEFYQFVDEIGGVWVAESQSGKEFGKIKADLKKKNKLIGDNDTWIAAICKANKATLVTTNIEHFRRVEGLKIV